MQNREKHFFQWFYANIPTHYEGKMVSIHYAGTHDIIPHPFHFCNPKMKKICFLANFFDLIKSQRKHHHEIILLNYLSYTFSGDPHTAR